MKPCVGSQKAILGILCLVLAGCTLRHPVAKHQMAPAYEILVLGDSITWGQGLLPKHKFTQLVGNALSQALHRPVTFKSFAHSGAIIGISDDAGSIAKSVTGFSDGEVPTSFPTIWNQVLEAQKQNHAYDLIIVDGCINDIGVSNILNPLPWAPNLNRAVVTQCHDHLLLLLEKIRDSNLLKPSGAVVVTGYYPILSWDSNRLPPVTEMLSTFLISLSHADKIAVETQERNRARGFTSFNLRHEMMHRALCFKAESDQSITRAVAEVRGFENRFHLALPEIPASRSAYAGSSAADTWIWEVRDKPVLQPLDEAQPLPRLPDCRVDYSSDREGRLFCSIASIGHPNEFGAIAYAEAVTASLHTAWKPTPVKDCD